MSGPPARLWLGEEGSVILGVNLDTYPVEFFYDADHGEGSEISQADIPPVKKDF